MADEAVANQEAPAPAIQKIAVGLGTQVKIGPYGGFNIETHVFQDASIDEMNAVADKLSTVANRQRAIAELEEFQGALVEETKILTLTQEALDKTKTEFPLKMQALKDASSERINSATNDINQKWIDGGRRGEPRLMPQDKSRVDSIRNQYTKDCCDLQNKYDGDVATYESTIRKIIERLDSINKSIAKRQAIVGTLPDSKG